MTRTRPAPADEDRRRRARLSIADMDFAEFAEAADATGTYRGFTDAGGAGERPAS